MIELRLPEKQILVEIWSDVVCPFCFIGKRNLELAVAALAETLPDAEGPQIDIIYKSFELDRARGETPVQNRSKQKTVQLLSHKYRISEAQALGRMESVMEMAKAVGLHFQLEKTWANASLDAHRLLQWALAEGRQAELKELMLKAYFEQARDLEDPAVLIQLATQAGLEAPRAEQILKTDAFIEEVRSDEAEAEGLNIQSVPFFVFNRKWAISGAQPVSVFREALGKALAQAPTQ